jgi:hypothetical protein
VIIGISGRKQSGKTTTGNFIVSLKLAELGICEKIDIDHCGRIVVSDLFGDKNYSGILDISVRNNDFMLNKLYNLLDPYIKVYSFADPLKQDICMNMLGLSYDQCYGSDDDKNSITDIFWENIPGNISKQGPMTAREVMEVVGTDLFRKIKGDVWVSTTLRKIQQDKAEIAVIVDCRFPNEVDSIKTHGGKIIRLTRNPFNSSATAEAALDSYNYDWTNFDYIINNENMTIYDQCMDIQKFLQETLSL